MARSLLSGLSLLLTPPVSRPCGRRLDVLFRTESRRIFHLRCSAEIAAFLASEQQHATFINPLSPLSHRILSWEPPPRRPKWNLQLQNKSEVAETHHLQINESDTSARSLSQQCSSVTADVINRNKLLDKWMNPFRGWLTLWVSHLVVRPALWPGATAQTP